MQSYLLLIVVIVQGIDPVFLVYLKRAFPNVSLWNKIYAEHQKDPPPVGGFWSVIRKYTNIDPEEAKKVEKKVRTRYMGDVSNISDEILDENLSNISDEESENSGLSDNNRGQNPKIPQQPLENRDMSEFTKLDLSTLLIKCHPLKIKPRNMSEFTKLDLSTSIIYLQKGNEKEEYKRIRRMFDADYGINDLNAKSEE